MKRERGKEHERDRKIITPNYNRKTQDSDFCETWTDIRKHGLQLTHTV